MATDVESNNLSSISTVESNAPKRSNVNGNMNNNNSARSSRVGSAAEQSGTVDATAALEEQQQQRYGWHRFQPQWLQRFCTAKWALFWLCWGGALQGEW